MKQWRFIETGFSNGFYNMAVDEALLDTYESSIIGCVLRLFLWKPPALSLGYFQKIEEVDLDVCNRMGIDVVRRPTGGRSILHDRELTYSVVMPADKSILESYKKINMALLRGLNFLGIKASLVPKEKKTDFSNSKIIRSSACFASASWYEIQADGKKILGSAQLRRKRALLQHGSLLLRLDREKLYSLFKFSSEEKRNLALQESYACMTSISEVLSEQPGIEQISFALKKGFEEEYDTELVSSCLSCEETERARSLENKYRSREWNYMR